MTFNTVAEVFDSIEQTRLRLYERVENLSEEQALFRPADGVWSVAEIAEHLSIFDSLILKLVRSLVAKGEASQPPLDANEIIGPISIQHLTTRIKEKDQAPEFLLPTGIPLESSIENLRQKREALLALKPRLQARDFTPVTYTDETLGPLNPYQWLAFTGYHEERHVGQISALISSESFPPQKALSA
jgi:uncharacterized damage-inducible protein DinB